MSLRDNYAVPDGFGDHDARAAVFLDIDGVLQGYGDLRFKHIKDGSIEGAYIELEEEFGVDYRKYDKYDVGAVYYDWSKSAVADLKRVLDTAGAKIVLSSDWRINGPAVMKDFFRIHGLDGYYVDDTIPYFIPGGWRHNWVPKGGFNPEFRQRTVEILTYLRNHPRIRRYVAIDDLDLSRGLEGHFVKTSCWMKPEEADEAIRILKGRSA
jgi:hypothetical protein